MNQVWPWYENPVNLVSFKGKKDVDSWILCPIVFGLNFNSLVKWKASQVTFQLTLAFSLNSQELLGVMVLNGDLIFEILKRVDHATIANARCVSSLFFSLQHRMSTIGRNYASHYAFHYKWNPLYNKTIVKETVYNSYLLERDLS